jgi:DNA-binding MurR/RpiR family transcriptional regulator
MRLCKALGYSGYREFLLQLAADISNQKSDNKIYTDIRAGDDLHTIIKNVAHNDEKSIADSVEVLNFDAVEKAVELLHQSKRIDFYGVGASYIVALDATQKFMRIGKYASSYSDTHLQSMAVSTLKKGDAAVFISYSGTTKDIIDAMTLANRKLFPYSKLPLNPCRK